MVLIYRATLLGGGSGVGKSSLVNAGFLPAILREDYLPERVRVRPQPNGEFQVERIPLGEANQPPYLPSRFISESLKESLVALSAEDFARVLSTPHLAGPPLLIFDQFEELITLFDETPDTPQKRAAATTAQSLIVHTLAEFVRDPATLVKFLFVFREDYYLKLGSKFFDRLPGLREQGMYLESFPKSRIRPLVREPFVQAADTGHPFLRAIDDALAAEIAKAIADYTDLPSVNLTEVQIICQTLWRDPNGAANFIAAPDKVQHIQSLLERFIDERLALLSEDVRGPAIGILTRLLTASDTRNIVAGPDLIERLEKEDHVSTEISKKALEELVHRSRLVNRRGGGDTAFYDVISEFLIPWIRRRRDMRRNKLREERRIQELLHKEKVRRNKIWALAASIVFIVSGLMVWFGMTQWKISNARGTALHALLKMEDDPELGLLLAIKSLNKSKTDQGKQALALGLAKSTVRAYLAGNVLSAEFSHDGAFIVTASDDEIVRLWDARTAKLCDTISADAKVKTASFNSDGTQIVAGCADGSVFIWNVKARTKIPLIGHARKVAIRTAVFSPTEGDCVLTASGDGSTRLWNARNGRAEGVIWAHRGGVNSSAFSSDGKTIVTAGTYDRTVSLWNADNPGNGLAYLVHPNEVYRAASNRDGSKIATASNDGIRIWNRRPMKTDAPNSSSPSGIPSPPPDTSDSLVHLWNLLRRLDALNSTPPVGVLPFSLDANGSSPPVQSAPPPILGHKGRVFSVVFSSDDSCFLSSGQDGTARLWNTFTEQQRSVFRGHSSSVSSAAFDPSSARIVTTSLDNTARIWTTTPSMGVPILTGEKGEFATGSFSRDANHIITTMRTKGKDERILPPSAVILDAKDHKQVGSPFGGDQQLAVLTAAFLRDGKSAVTTIDGSSVITVSDVATGEALRTLGKNDPKRVNPVIGVSCSDDGKHFVTAMKDGTVICWNYTGEQERTIWNPLLPVVNAVISPDGTKILTANVDGIARLWSVRSGNEVKLLKRYIPKEDEGKPLESLCSAVFQPDGQGAVTTASDGTVTLWDATYNEIGTMREHTAAVRLAAFSHDSTHLATGSDDGRVIIWKGKRKVADLQVCPPGLLSSVAFNPDGSQLITTSVDGVLQLIPWQTETQKDLADRRVYRQLTSKEEDDYVPSFLASLKKLLTDRVRGN